MGPPPSLRSQSICGGQYVRTWQLFRIGGTFRFDRPYVQNDLTLKPINNSGYPVPVVQVV